MTDGNSTVPMNLHWNSEKGYFMTPASPNVDKKGTARLNASDKNCTICFNPTNTPFGASQNVQTGSPIDIPVGDSNYSVGYCITDYQSTCTPPAPNSPLLTATGTIKVGSGTVGGLRMGSPSAPGTIKTGSGT